MRIERVAIVALVLFAGCAGAAETDASSRVTETVATERPATEAATPSPTAAPTPTRTATAIGPSRLNESQFRTEYAEQLRVNDVDVDDTYYEHGSLYVRYRTHAANQSAFAAEFFAVAAWYPRLLELHDGYEPPSVRLWVETAGGDKLAEYAVERSWARDLVAGQINRTTYRTRILETETR